MERMMALFRAHHTELEYPLYSTLVVNATLLFPWATLELAFHNMKGTFSPCHGLLVICKYLWRPTGETVLLQTGASIST